jgi:hypothetical protein
VLRELPLRVQVAVGVELDARALEEVLDHRCLLGQQSLLVLDHLLQLGCERVAHHDLQQLVRVLLVVRPVRKLRLHLVYSQLDLRALLLQIVSLSLVICLVPLVPVLVFVRQVFIVRALALRKLVETLDYHLEGLLWGRTGKVTQDLCSLFLVEEIEGGVRCVNLHLLKLLQLRRHIH